MLRNKSGISTSLVMAHEGTELHDVTEEINLPEQTIYDNVLITPSYMEFKNAVEGITLRECLTIRNTGKKIAYIRINEPNSIALKIKTLKHRISLSPGLALKKWVSYCFKRPALLHAAIPIEINGYVIDYQIICVYDSEYIEIAPTSIDFGIVDIGCSSGIRLLTISNVGGKSTRFTVDLGNNDMDINIKPHRGIVRPSSTVQLHVRMIGINEGTFFNEFWIKSTPNIRVPVKAKIIIPRLEIDYPNTTGDFTLVDFSSTFVRVTKYDTLTLKNISSQFSSFVVLAELENQLIPIEEVDSIKYPEFQAFKISPIEGRLDSFHSIGFTLSFNPTRNLMHQQTTCHFTQDFMIFLRIVRVHCTEVEDILRAEKRTEPKPDDPPIHKVHIQDGSSFSSNSSISTSLIHRTAELVTLCLHGEAELPHLRFLPNELHFNVSQVNEVESQIINIENLSEKSSVNVISVKNPILNCIPSEMLIGPQSNVRATINIARRKHESIECSFYINFDIVVNSAVSSRQNIKVKIATYSIKCFLKKNMTKNKNTKAIHKIIHKVTDNKISGYVIETEECKPLTLKSFVLIHTNKSQQSKKFIDTTTKPLSPLQIYHVKVSPTMFTFGAVAQRVPSYQELTFENQNKFPVMIHLASLSAKNIRFLTGDLMILKPNEVITKLVEFRGDQIGKFNSYIDYVINNHHTYELALTADVNYKYLILSQRQIIIGSNYLQQESYQPLDAHLELKNRLNAKTNFKWEIPKTTSYIIQPFVGAVRGKKNMWINISHILNFIKSEQGEAVVICESGYQVTLKLNTVSPILNVAFLNDNIDVGEIELNLPHKVKSVLHNAGNTAVLFQVDLTGTPHGCDVYPQRGIISPHGIIIIFVTLKFCACVQFTLNINVIIQKKKNLTLKIKGDVPFPKIKFTPNVIDVGRMSVGSYQIFKLSALNNGNVPITLRFPLEDFPEFRIASVATQLNDLNQYNMPIRILPGKIKFLYLHLQPIKLASYKIYLPIIINDILGPVIIEKFDSLHPKKFLKSYETLYNNIGIIKLLNLPPMIPKILIEGTIIGQILTYNKLYFYFDVDQNLLEDILHIRNSSIMETPFVVQINKSFMTNSAFSIKWDNGKEPQYDSNDETFTCSLLAQEDIYFRINYQPIDEEFTTSSIAVSASGEFDAKMFNKIILEGKRYKPSIVSNINEIFFDPIPLMIESKQIFHVTISNFPQNTKLIGNIKQSRKYSGTFTKDILTITFPTGNILITEENKIEKEIHLKLRSKYSVSFQTRIAISDENSKAILFITVYGIVDNCLLTMHAHSIVFNENTKYKNTKCKMQQYDIHQSSYPSLRSVTSDNETKIHINQSYLHISSSQPRLSSIHSELSQTRKLMNVTSVPKLKSSLTHDDIDDEIEITVTHESKMSLTSPESTKYQYLNNFSYPFFPDSLKTAYENHMHRTIEAAERWMYSDPLKFQFNLDITHGITAVLSGLCSLNRASSDKRKVHTVDKSFLNILALICGEKIHNYIDIPKLLPTEINERINLVMKLYDDMLTFLLSHNAHVSHINSKYLLSYDDYCIINPTDNISELIFECRSKQSWLDVILQTYKQFVLSKVKISAIVDIANDTVAHQSMDIVRTLSSSRSSCTQLLTQADINIITKKVNEKNHIEAEAILLAWLEYHYEQQCKEDWLHSMDEKNNLQQRLINNFDGDLIDSLVFITVTASYCPYLIDEYFRNIFFKPKSPEEHLHNAICVVKAWRKIRLGFIITPQEIIQPNSVQMLMLIVHLFQILPTYLVRNKVKFSCGLTEDAIRHIGINNVSDAPVNLILEFFHNGLELFSIVDADSIIRLNSHDSKTIKIKYHARKLSKTRAYLLLCGSAIGPNFARSSCFMLEGNTSHVSGVEEYKFKTEIYCTVDRIIGVKVPYNFEADYDIWFTEEKPEKPSSLKMIRWSELRKIKIPRRLFLNQKTLSVIQNAHKANLSVTIACIAPKTRTFWLIFQAKLGDFIIQIVSISKSSLTHSINVEWEKNKCICTLPRIMETCPLNIKIPIPSRNIKLWDCVIKMFRKCLNPREQAFWTKQLETNVGLKLIHWLMESHEDNTAKEIFHIFSKNVDYTVSVLDKENHLLFPKTFNIFDVRQLHKTTEMRIHLPESFSELYSTVLTLVSRDEREQRHYNVTLICKKNVK